MPDPTFDRTTGHWSIRWIDTSGRRVSRKLGKHPGHKTGKAYPPKVRPPAFVIQAAKQWQDKAADAKQGIDHNPDRPIDLAQFLADYRAVKAASVSQSTLDGIDLATRHFMEYCTARGVTTLRAVTAKVIREYMAERKGVAAFGTVTTEKGYIAPAWSQAVVDEMITVNPWRLVKTPGKQKAERPVFMELDEIAKLKAVCPDWLQDVITVGVNTGIRISALINLRWDAIKWDAGEIVVKASDSKSGRTYAVPMSGECRDVLQRLSAMDDEDEFVLPMKVKRHRHNIMNILGRATKKAGIPDRGHYAHIFRHTFATHAAKVVQLHVLQRWMGHASIQMTMKYAHVSEEESRRQMEKFSLTPKSD